MGLKALLNKLLNQDNTAVMEADSEVAMMDTIIDEIIAEVRGDRRHPSYYSVDIRSFSKYKELKNADNEVRCNVFFRAIERLEEVDAQSLKRKNFDNELYFKQSLLRDFLAVTLRTAIKFTDEEYANILLAFKKDSGHRWGGDRSYPVKSLLKHIEKKAKKSELSDDLRKRLDEATNWKPFNIDYQDSIELKSLLNQVRAIASGEEKELAPLQFSDDDYFGRVANETFKSAKNLKAWYSMMHMSLKAKSSKPSQKYIDEAKGYINQIGEKVYLAEMKKWLDAYGATKVELRTRNFEHNGEPHSYQTHVHLTGNNAQMLKGILWTLLASDATSLAPQITKAAEKSFQKIPWRGPAAAGLGNAAIYVLANIEGLEGLSYMSRLKLKIRQNNTQKLIQNNIDRTAEKMGITPAVAEEICVPDFGFIDGLRTEDFGDYILKVALNKIGKPELKWAAEDGREQKSVPSVVKGDDILNEQLKAVKAELKEVQKVFSSQKYRIDRMFKQNREWEYGAFMERYIDHGLVTNIAAKMLWRIKLNGDWQVLRCANGVWFNLNDEQVEIPRDDMLVRMWHPIDSDVDTVLAWREKMTALEISQPVKQVYRELYLLTDAEINTKSYSNRMAAHIIKQHQFNVLTSLRGWKYSLLGAYDDGRSGEIAETRLAEHNIRAEFWVDEVNADDAWTDSGIWQYVATDQVRFVKAGKVMDLIDVPKIVFSEIMRDVDLFVGVCSVGNDPLWQDQGGLPQYRDYWTSYSFGELSEVANTRKQVLEKLLPRLKIKNVATIDGRWLRVKGTVREYKIHLGSTNILMEPNDQYLCIVPDRKTDKSVDKVFLPFEGDRGLSLVLSKAFLLAADDKIKDTTILSQIRRS